MSALSNKTLVRLAPEVMLTLARLSQLLNVPEEDLILESREAARSLAPNLKKSYFKRFSMFYEGGIFCIERLYSEPYSGISVEAKEKLVLYLKMLRENFLGDIRQMSLDQGYDAFQSLLGDYCNRLVSAFVELTPYKFEQVVGMLAKAEEYMVLLGGRPDLVTVSKLNKGEEEGFLVQRERKISPLSNELREEFWGIRACIKGECEEFELPEWYVELESLERGYLENVLLSVKRKEELDSLFASYSSRLRGLLGPANFREHSYQWVAEPDVAGEPFSSWSDAKRLTSSIISSRDVSSKSSEVRVEHAVRNLEIIVNHGIEQYLSARLEALGIDETLQDGQEISMPVLVQTLISPMNPHDHELMRDKKKGLEEFNKVLLGEQSEWVRSNYPKALQVTLNNGQRRTVNVMPVLYSSNHPLNYLKHIGPTLANDPECLSIRELAKEYLQEHPEKNEVRDLLESYKQLLQAVSANPVLAHVDAVVRTAMDKRGRELFISSLEQLLFEKIGGVPYGSCVSAKDRKGLEFIHTDAMKLYFSIYQCWPSCSDGTEARARFVDLYAELYVTRHHHESGGQNAPGAEGIKTPYMYLPADIRARITELYDQRYGPKVASLWGDNQLADNNELKAVLKRAKATRETCASEVKEELEKLAPTVKGYIVVPDTKVQDKRAVSTYSADQLRKVHSMLKEILTANKFWNAHTSWQCKDFYSLTRTFKKYVYEDREPEGVRELREELDNRSRYHAFSEHTLASLAQKVTFKQNNSGRSKETVEFYEIVGNLIRDMGNPVLAGKTMERFCAFHQKVINYQRTYSRLASSPSAEEGAMLRSQSAPAMGRDPLLK